MSKKAKIIYVAVMVLLLLIGLGCILYSPFATWYNERHKAEIHSQFQDVIENADNSVLNAEKEAAIKYNDELYHKSVKYFSPEANGYYGLLNLTGNGLMGYIRIPCIEVSLPIYHSVSAEVLNTGAGHLPETSLPVGGKNTHSAISAHSGMAGNAMFSELERVKIGDLFYIDILGETLTYKIIQIDVVTPDDGSLLNIVPGEDLVTLITCTPYGINTHRLLVRGTRVYPEETPVTATNVQTDSTDRGMPIRTKYTFIAIAIGGILGTLLVFIVAIVVRLWNRRGKNARRGNGSIPDTTPILHTEFGGSL